MRIVSIVTTRLIARKKNQGTALDKTDLEYLKKMYIDLYHENSGKSISAKELEQHYKANNLGHNSTFGDFKDKLS